MSTMEWMKSKAISGTRKIEDQDGVLTVNYRRFAGKLPYRMMKEAEKIKERCGYNNGNEFCEQVITRRNKLGYYDETIYIYEEFVK